ncbi:unnamed protein product [Cladocopium goreaui]|uniref:Uncharacterized protein n=1 Tax=Cladocopium goreaui TaxID=2562237 RepID=A0A9P1GSI9_9DINO|nr:unnamed protein product [Cladocopium goreaui]
MLTFQAPVRATPILRPPRPLRVQPLKPPRLAPASTVIAACWVAARRPLKGCQGSSSSPRLTEADRQASAMESPGDAAQRSEEKERLQGILDEMQELLTEMCDYTSEEVKEDSDVKLIEEARRRICAESLPSYKAWAKENNILMPKTRKESFTMFKRKKTARRHGLMQKEHYSNTNRGKERKSHLAEQKAFQKAKRKEIAQKRRQQRERDERGFYDVLSHDEPAEVQSFNRTETDNAVDV